MVNITMQGREDLRYTFLELWQHKDSTIEACSILKSAENCKNVQEFSFRGDVTDMLDNLLLVDKDKLKDIIGGREGIRGIRLFSRLCGIGALVVIKETEQPESQAVLIEIVDVQDREHDNLIGDNYRIPVALLTKTNLQLVDTIDLGVPYFEMADADIGDRKIGLTVCIPIRLNAENNTVEVISYSNEKFIGTSKVVKEVAPRKIRPISKTIKRTLRETAIFIDTEKLSQTFNLPQGSLLTGFEFEEFDLENDKSIKIKSIGTNVSMEYEDFLDCTILDIVDISGHVAFGARPRLQVAKLNEEFFNESLTISQRLFNQGNTEALPLINSEEANQVQEILNRMT